MVMGHESCGAVKAAIDDVKLGNITPMLTKIAPAVKESQDFEGDKTTKNPGFVAHVCENNVQHTIDTIREKSPVMKKLEDEGIIKIVGACLCSMCRKWGGGPLLAADCGTDPRAFCQ